MPQQFLDHPQIGTASEQVGGEGVPEHVWVDVLQAGPFGKSSDDLPDSNAFEGPTSIAQKQTIVISTIIESGEFRIETIHIKFHCLACRHANRHQSFTVPFSMYEDNTQRFLVLVETDGADF